MIVAINMYHQPIIKLSSKLVHENDPLSKFFRYEFVVFRCHHGSFSCNNFDESFTNGWWYSSHQSYNSCCNSSQDFNVFLKMSSILSCSKKELFLDYIFILIFIINNLMSPFVIFYTGISCNCLRSFNIFNSRAAHFLFMKLEKI